MKKFLFVSLFLIGLGWALSNFSGLANKGVYDSIILDFREDIGITKIVDQIMTISDEYQVTPRLNSEFSTSDNVYIVKGDRQILKNLKNSLGKYIEYIEPNYIYRADAITFDSDDGIPNDPMYGKQWNLRSINVESAWNKTQGDGITVAIIDTGVSRVPDLQQTKFVPGYDFVNDRTLATDDSGHGTHIAGTIAQSTNNNYGVAGIAYEASIMPLKVLSASGGGTVADIAESIKFAADNGADIINMSLGGGGESQIMKEAIDYAHNKGLVIIAAVGNANQNSANYPARYPHVIGVSATDAAGEKAPYSNFGAGVDISAPGGSTSDKNEAGGILQETINPENGKSVFASFQGTSMASPHVAGVAALVKASGIQDPEEITNILKKSARAVKEDPLNHFGVGQLDAAAAVTLAIKGQITFRDFFRWLYDNGYLNPGFWLDGGAVALLPKLGMVLGSYILACLLRNYFPFSWSFPLHTGLVAGSSGLFFLRGFYLFDLPQWPMRVMGSSLPEIGGAIQGSSILNPIFASVLIPALLILLLLGHQQWKWVAIGTTIGVASCLIMSAIVNSTVWGLGTGITAQIFLVVNALLCLSLARLAIRTGEKLALD